LFNASRDSLDHWMQGFSLKSHTQGVWDWELAWSSVDYGTDLSRSATVNSAANLLGIMGNNSATLQDQKGTGWRTLALKGSWRPQGHDGAHLLDFGLTQDNYQLRINKSNLSATDNWLSSAPVSLNADVGGKSQLQGLYAQDAWAFAPAWKTVLGARLENWRTADGYATSLIGVAEALDSYSSRNETYLSPKAALAYQWAPDMVLKASLGRAVRMPTVSELYGATSKCTDISSRILSTVCPAGQTWVNDPGLRPEKSITAELTLEKELGHGVLRLTWFNEEVADALYSQAAGLKSDGATLVTMVQNIDKVSTQGLEIAYQGENVVAQGLDLSGSLTYADSRIVANASYVAVPGDTIGKQQPRVPLWRASLLANYRWDTQLSTSVGLRYSGDQFSSLNNTDINGFAYTAASRFLVVDVRARYAINAHLALSAGIDNLGNVEYWNFHPYPGRTLVAELQYRL
jgi:iron complex outermembrane receptor protein